MAKNFDTEIREVFDKPYLKVYVKDLAKIESIRSFLNDMKCVQKANITSSSSKNSPSENLTLYPSRVYDVKEMQSEVIVSLNSFFSGSPVDPSFIEEAFSSISQKAYRQIINIIDTLGRNMEKSKGLYQSFDEEGIRSCFLPYLNAISQKYTATGETFNKIGKTDILIQNESGENVFIAECKIWRGQSQLSEAIDQLLSRYVNWRDEKVALIVFNKTNTNFSDVISKSKKVMEAHNAFEEFKGTTSRTSFAYKFVHPEDNNKKVCIELMLFNFA